MEDRIRLLSLVDIFEPLSTKEIEQLNGQLSDIHLEPGDIFFSPQEHSERLFLLQKGRVRIYKTRGLWSLGGGSSTSRTPKP